MAFIRQGSSLGVAGVLQFLLPPTAPAGVPRKDQVGLHRAVPPAPAADGADRRLGAAALAGGAGAALAGAHPRHLSQRLQLLGALPAGRGPDAQRRARRRAGVVAGQELYS